MYSDPPLIQIKVRSTNADDVLALDDRSGLQAESEGGNEGRVANGCGGGGVRVSRINLNQMMPLFVNIPHI